MSKKYELADVLYEQITTAAKALEGASSHEVRTTGVEQLAKAYAKVAKVDKRSTKPSHNTH